MAKVRNNRRQAATLTEQIRALMPEAVETVVTSVTADEAVVAHGTVVVEEVEVEYSPWVELVTRPTLVTPAPTPTPTEAPTEAPTPATTSTPAMPELPTRTPPAELLAAAVKMAGATVPDDKVVEAITAAAIEGLPVVEEEPEDLSLPLAVRLLRKRSLRERMLDKTSPVVETPWWKF